MDNKPPNMYIHMVPISTYPLGVVFPANRGEVQTMPEMDS
jgi:hypothetical protein